MRNVGCWDFPSAPRTFYLFFFTILYHCVFVCVCACGLVGKRERERGEGDYCGWEFVDGWRVNYEAEATHPWTRWKLLCDRLFVSDEGPALPPTAWHWKSMRKCDVDKKYCQVAPYCPCFVLFFCFTLWYKSCCIVLYSRFESFSFFF